MGTTRKKKDARNAPPGGDQPAPATAKGVAATVEAAAGGRAPKRKSIDDVHISPETRVRLYGLARSLPKDFRQEAGLLLPFATYFHDPFVARLDAQKGFEEELLVAWEPGLADGPTSSRFAVVDYDADADLLAPPARWDEKSQTFTGPAREALGREGAAALQFHQVSVWAQVQCALAFFENPSALGRPVPWAFEGNRLIVVPHAGYGENAYYDRASKSLQLYYFESEGETIYTCLSADIVNHELGHAVLDGIRPLYSESVEPQTAAFHEFFGDWSAILLTLTNGILRGELAKSSGGRFENATALSSLAEQFGQAVEGRPYLRTACNELRLGERAGELEPHRLSEVLTGTLFEALIAIGANYQEPDPNGAKKTPPTPVQAFWYAADRMQRTVIQPLDLLPPVEVTFRDYALAVCRSQQLSDPLDPEGYYRQLISIFRSREILTEEDQRLLEEPRYLHERLELAVRHDLDSLSRSRAGAYRFLDDNRESLLIPASRDFFVADLYDCRKRGRQNLPLPRQIVVQYAWREEVELPAEPRFGRFAGAATTLLCGGTLVFTEDGNIASWMHKPGSEPYGGKRERGGKTAAAWQKARQEGAARQARLLDVLAAQIAAGRVGNLLASPLGLATTSAPPMTAEEEGGQVRFRLSPHLHLCSHDQDELFADKGDRKWEISC